MEISAGDSSMDSVPFHDGNIARLIDNRSINSFHDDNRNLQMHSSLIKRLSLERELEGHTGCVNTIAWNSCGSLLISGSDDQCVNVWRYSTRKLLHSIESGHSSNIFCAKFVPETSDELVASGAGDCEVRVFNISCSSGRRAEATPTIPLAHFQCHTKRVKKLAVEVGNPHVVWSASEDGTLRQHDLRESCSCPPDGSAVPECRNVLLDLRHGEKRSLSDPPNGTLNLKSCDISVTRPHLLLVGGSDAFARLYDRRMLPPLSSCQRRLSPPPCVNYFCPMHLSVCGGRSLHLTHVTFSPSGEEVLISYSGEHVYLFDVNQGVESSVQYTSGDVAKQWTISSIVDNSLSSTVNLGEMHSIRGKTGEQCLRHDKWAKLLQNAEKCLKEGSNYYHGIEACNEVLYGHGCETDPMLKHDCLCVRATLLLKRKWKNDAHMAVKDLNEAFKINSSSFRALYYMSEALVELGKHKEALDFALAAQCVVPSFEVAERVESIKKHLAAEAEKSSSARHETPKPESQPGRVVSLSNLFSRSVASNDPSQDISRFEREDSDYDEEIELDFEPSVSGDEERDDDSNVLHGSLNLRIHRRDSPRDSSGSNGLSTSQSTQNEKATYKPEVAIDMRRRYVGHCNMGTDIKQASFLGQKGEYIASGSDDGRWFIWEKKTGRLIKMLHGDEAVVNCIQCHPFDNVVATGGIDNTIKIWTPAAAVPSMVSSAFAGPDVNPLEAMESNERSLSRVQGPFVPFEILERLGMPDSFEGSLGSLQGIQCTQS